MKRITCLFCLVFFLFKSHAQQTQDPSLIKSIYFGGGSYYIDYQQIKELNEWLDSIDGLEQYDIIIHSHTDNIGSLEYNQQLSELRSEAVLRQLLRRGIPKETISIEDFGETNPVFDNSTLEGKLNNRRVDVFLKPPST